MDEPEESSPFPWERQPKPDPVPDPGAPDRGVPPARRGELPLWEIELGETAPEPSQSPSKPASEPRNIGAGWPQTEAPQPEPNLPTAPAVERRPETPSTYEVAGEGTVVTSAAPPPDASPSGRTKRFSVVGLLNLIMAILLAALIVIPFTPVAKKAKKGMLDLAEKISGKPQIIKEEVEVPVEVVRHVEVLKEVPVEIEVEVVKEIEVAVPMPIMPPSDEIRYVPYRKIDLGSMFSGIQIRSEMEAIRGGSATQERAMEDSYEVEFRVRLNVPRPSRNIKDLAAINPHLPEMLPRLGQQIENAKISPFYHILYETKATDIQNKLTGLERLLSRHNYFDCETVLEIMHPPTGQRVLLIQAEMDVVTDGSDGDRAPALDDYISMSKNYQPFTSYRWKKKTKTPNPLLSRWKENLAKAKAAYAKKGLSKTENDRLRSEIKKFDAGIKDMSTSSYLIAEADPFVVLPLSMLGFEKNNRHAPTIGDYAVVIHRNKAYPAIVGDAGPAMKIGEASLRIAREIDSECDPYHRPVSELAVTYLVFPQTADRPAKAPDLKRWHARCQKLIDAIGGFGSGYQLHRWSDPFAPKPKAPESASKTGDSDANLADPLHSPLGSE